MKIYSFLNNVNNKNKHSKENIKPIIQNLINQY